eukprot:COSAG06_NODE_31378_length_522_cov_1.744681_1_plen_29_part_10
MGAPHEMSSSLEDSPYIAVVDHPPEVAAA